MKLERVIDFLALILFVLWLNGGGLSLRLFKIETDAVAWNVCGLLALSWLYAKHVFSRNILVP